MQSRMVLGHDFIGHDLFLLIPIPGLPFPSTIDKGEKLKKGLLLILFKQI